jgi:hypothetical protein
MKARPYPQENYWYQSIFFFAVLIFSDFLDCLATQCATDEQRADNVIDQVTQPAQGYTQPVKGENQ